MLHSQENVSCSLCYRTFRGVKYLPCDHVFCLTCLQNRFAEVCLPDFDGFKFTCPCCQLSIDVICSEIRNQSPTYIYHHILELLEKELSGVGDREYDLSGLPASMPCRRQYLCVDSMAGTRPNFVLSNINNQHTVSGVAMFINSTRDNNNFQVSDESLHRCTTSTGQSLDITEIKEFMKKHCIYKLEKQVNPNTCFHTHSHLRRQTSLSASLNSYERHKSTSETPGGRIRDAVYLGNGTFLGINKNTKNGVTTGNAILFGESSGATNFSSSLFKTNVVPIYVECDTNNIYITGWHYEGPTQSNRIYKVYKCSTSGVLLKNSEGYLMTDVNYHALCGFFIDTVARKLYVTQPSEHNILCLDLDSLKDLMQSILLDDTLHPSFIVKYIKNDHFWISCTKDHYIIVINEDGTQTKKINVKSTYNAKPGPLVFTTDHRLMVLDLDESRIFWVKRHGDYIVLQRIICSLTKEGSITGLKATNDGKLLLCTNGVICIYKPRKLLSQYDVSYKSANDKQSCEIS